MTDEDRISVNPNVCHGKPCIAGTRIPVYLIIEMIESGLTFNEIIEEYPHVKEEDIRACLRYAKKLL